MRVARATVFAVACVVLACLAHLVGGGMVHVDALVTGLALTLPAALALAWRERSLPPILFVLTLVQAGLHTLFGAMCPVEAVPAPEHPAHGAPGAGMLVAHAWAVVLTALWLARGERALWTLLRLLLARGLRLLWLVSGGFVEHRPPSRPVRARACASPSFAPLRHAVVRRGPPPGIVAVDDRAW
ncbi:MFS transporter [Rhizohabitans arisaemae]|uniref:MFS transporter n=1 Tax=Rhizohabitans arisaemae TaxID=2720610 RepID=UPI0024B0B07D|nr:MFS transporter [Rhizohabitans arisaemae]